MLAIESLLILLISVLIQHLLTYTLLLLEQLGVLLLQKVAKISIENQYINEDDQFSHSKEILKLPIRTWFDKYESEIMAKELESGKKLSDEYYKLSRHTGLIAEEVEELGFNEFVILMTTEKSKVSHTIDFGFI